MAPDRIPEGTGAKRPAQRSKRNNIMVQTYGLTVRHNPKYKKNGQAFSISEKKILYDDIQSWLKDKGLKISNLYYEQKGGLHFHCRAESKKKIYYKKYQRYPFSIVFKKMYNEAGWLSYCKKEIVEKYHTEQKQLCQFYLDNYAFSSVDE